MGNENKIFIKTTEKDGVLIDHYNDLYGLVSAWQNKKGEVNLELVRYALWAGIQANAGKNTAGRQGAGRYNPG